MCAEGAGEDRRDARSEVGVGEVSLEARSAVEASRLASSMAEEGRPGPSGAGRWEVMGLGWCWGDEANCRGGAMVAGGGVGEDMVAVLATGGVHTPPVEADGILEAAEAKGEKAP